ncbi:MAG: hypothetical protein Q4C77_02785 [Eubacteriales bacterium]|nr:hypothetical protein [Eubacteriales bacterium]
MAVKAVLFDEKGNVIKEVKGDLVSIQGVEYKHYPFGIGIELHSASTGKMIPETLPEIFCSEANNMIDKVVKETRGDVKALDVRMKTVFLIASGGERR